MNTFTVTLTKMSKVAVVLIGLILVGYIGYLVFVQYRNQIALQDSALNQLRFDSEKRALAISYFYLEREYDLRQLAESRELSAYFENKALGMSMEYGLQASLITVDELFDRMRQKKRLLGRSLFSRIVFVDAAGRKLNDSHSPEVPKENEREWRKLIHIAKPQCSIFSDMAGNDPQIIISHPCFFKEKYAGQVVGWISSSLVYDYFIEGESKPSRYPGAVIFGKQYLHVSEKAREFVPKKTLTIPSDIQPGQPYRLHLPGNNQKSNDGYAILVPVRDTPFSLMTFLPPSEQFDFKSPRQLLYTTGGVAVFILAGMFFFLRINIRNRLLTAHLEETTLREQAVDGKNRQLAAEINERKIAEASLQRERDFVESLFETAQVIMLVLDTSGRVVRFNKYMEEISGYRLDEARGREWFSEFIPEEDREHQRRLFLNILLDDQSHGNVYPIITKTGQRREIEWYEKTIRDTDDCLLAILSIGQDITERKRLEAELLKTEKLESLGVLAGGIAHDFNNLLTAIMGNISVAKMLAIPGEELHQRLTNCEQASKRAVDLTRQLLTFSRGGAPIRKAASIADIIKESTGFALRGSNVRCEFSIPEDIWPVEVDAGQISQVIHNLIINADQAMPDGGVIEVRCENVIIDAEKALSIKEGLYLKISIIDKGVGIPDEYLGKIFDPYFTTKKKGSGLGLASSFSIIKNHDGTITVESAQSVGTTFCIYIPASRIEQPLESERREAVMCGTGRILVMEDDDVVRYIIGVMLKKLGYEVDFAEEGEDAATQYSAAMTGEKPFDAVIMDLTIPGGMGGVEAIRKLREIDPRVKGIVSSGYSNDPVMANFSDYGFRGVAKKPYTLEELDTVLRKVISDIS